MRHTGQVAQICISTGVNRQWDNLSCQPRAFASCGSTGSILSSGRRRYGFRCAFYAVHWSAVNAPARSTRVASVLFVLRNGRCASSPVSIKVGQLVKTGAISPAMLQQIMHERGIPRRRSRNYVPLRAGRCRATILKRAVLHLAQWSGFWKHNIFRLGPGRRSISPACADIARVYLDERLRRGWETRPTKRASPPVHDTIHEMT